MRDTDYATLRAEGRHGDSRIERIYVKQEGQDEIRFAWWPDGKIANRPLDIPESVLLPLMKDAIEKGVFTRAFLFDLHQVLSTCRPGGHDANRT